MAGVLDWGRRPRGDDELSDAEGTDEENGFMSFRSGIFAASSGSEADVQDRGEGIGE